MTEPTPSPSAAAPGPEPAPAAAAGEPLTAAEFRAAYFEHEQREHARLRLIRIQNQGPIDGLISTAGWIAVSLAFWLLLIGYFAIRGELRGRP